MSIHCRFRSDEKDGMEGIGKGVGLWLGLCLDKIDLYICEIRLCGREVYITNVSPISRSE